MIERHRSVGLNARAITTTDSGYETLNIAPSDVVSSAEFAWKQASTAITISGLEQIQNAGPERVIDLLEARIGNGEKTMVNNIASDCYSDGKTLH